MSSTPPVTDPWGKGWGQGKRQEKPPKPGSKELPELQELQSPSPALGPGSLRVTTVLTLVFQLLKPSPSRGLEQGGHSFS